MESLDEHSTNTADTSNTSNYPHPQKKTKKRDTTLKEALTWDILNTQHSLTINYTVMERGSCEKRDKGKSN